LRLLLIFLPHRCYFVPFSLRANSDDGRRRSQSYLPGTLGIQHIFSIEPLRISIHENEAPREPNFEETEVLVKKLFEVYRQQKQQV
jgi:hypothetical protein